MCDLMEGMPTERAAASPTMLSKPLAKQLTQPLAQPLADQSGDSTLAGEVANRLIAAVALGEYLPGSRLPAERELASALGVGRVTVRTAIARLVSLGLLRSRPGRGGGTFVVDSGASEASEASGASATVAQVLTSVWQRMIDQHEAQGWMHGTIAAAAAERHREEDVGILQQRLLEFAEAESGPDSQRADERLHLAIAHAAHNPALSDALFTLERQMHLSAPSHPWGPESGWSDMERRALKDHRALVDAILRRDLEDAQRIGRAHAHINMEMLEDSLAAVREAAGIGADPDAGAE